ncbi:MAG TPA: hypothetical protein VFI41_12665 [Gemmatimonadales bacterium]|nr:hypothetical protein [Gemmatimonadales bacterium]
MITDAQLGMWVASRKLTDPTQKIARYDDLLDALVQERRMSESLAGDVADLTSRQSEIGLPDAPPIDNLMQSQLEEYGLPRMFTT